MLKVNQDSIKELKKKNFNLKNSNRLLAQALMSG